MSDTFRLILCLIIYEDRKCREEISGKKSEVQVELSRYIQRIYIVC